jgi:hypothetical protein
MPPMRPVAHDEGGTVMHVRYCECDACLPGVPAQPTRVVSWGRRYANPRERKRAQNARAYQRRKLRALGMHV